VRAKDPRFTLFRPNPWDAATGSATLRRPASLKRDMSNLQPRKPKRSGQRRSCAWGLILQILLLGGLTAVIGSGAYVLYEATRHLPALEELGVSSLATNIYSADNVLLARIYSENRESVKISEIPQNVQNATIAIEDERFMTHSGVDFRGIGRALYENLTRTRLSQGGSTITQQLARNVYALGRKKTFGRKVQEAIIALRLERRYSKPEILEGYLNEVFYGARSYGIQSASKTYFGKPCNQLTLAEAALLAGIPQRPNYLNPFVNPEQALARRNVVLAKMEELNLVTTEEAEKARHEKLRLAKPRKQTVQNWKAPYFVDAVMRELENRYDPDMIYRGGLQVYTSLNYAMQQAAEKAVTEGVQESIRARRINPQTQVALTCVDPHNGYIRAMVGGRDWSKSQFNRAINNKRQPGSTFKLFVYTAALESGWSPYRRVQDARRSWKTAGGKVWSPQNYDYRYRGSVTLKTAFALSINMAAINTAEAIGINNAIKVARRLGLKGKLEPNLATAIGAGGASTLEMASAYGAFAVKGSYISPVSIIVVKDRDGNDLERYDPQVVLAVKANVVEDMCEMLRAVITQGTGRKAGAVPDAYGKTGTTQDLRDAWFVGFTPQLSTAVWVGNDAYTPMPRASGGDVCAPIWVNFMSQALKLNPRNRPDYTNTSPSGQPGGESTAIGSDGPLRLRICPDSGQIATNRCPHWNTRRFKPGEAPTRACELHPGSPLNPVPQASATNSADSTPAPVPIDIIPDNTPPVEEIHIRDDGGNNETRTEAPTKPRTDPIITVDICADSNQRATYYCPATRTIRVRQSEAPKSECPLHRPPNP